MRGWSVCLCVCLSLCARDVCLLLRGVSLCVVCVRACVSCVHVRVSMCVCVLHGVSCPYFVCARAQASAFAALEARLAAAEATVAVQPRTVRAGVWWLSVLLCLCQGLYVCLWDVFVFACVFVVCVCLCLC